MTATLLPLMAKVKTITYIYKYIPFDSNLIGEIAPEVSLPLTTINQTFKTLNTILPFLLVVASAEVGDSDSAVSLTSSFPSSIISVDRASSNYHKKRLINN